MVKTFLIIDAAKFYGAEEALQKCQAFITRKITIENFNIKNVIFKMKKNDLAQDISSLLSTVMHDIGMQVVEGMKLDLEEKEFTMYSNLVVRILANCLDYCSAVKIMELWRKLHAVLMGKMRKNTRNDVADQSKRQKQLLLTVGVIQAVSCSEKVQEQLSMCHGDGQVLTARLLEEAFGEVLKCIPFLELRCEDDHLFQDTVIQLIGCSLSVCPVDEIADMLDRCMDTLMKKIRRSSTDCETRSSLCNLVRLIFNAFACFVKNKLLCDSIKEIINALLYTIDSKINHRNHEHSLIYLRMYGTAIQKIMKCLGELVIDKDLVKFAENVMFEIGIYVSDQANRGCFERYLTKAFERIAQCSLVEFGTSDSICKVITKLVVQPEYSERSDGCISVMLNNNGDIVGPFGSQITFVAWLLYVCLKYEAVRPLELIILCGKNNATLESINQTMSESFMPDGEFDEQETMNQQQPFQAADHFNALIAYPCDILETFFNTKRADSKGFALQIFEQCTKELFALVSNQTISNLDAINFLLIHCVNIASPEMMSEIDMILSQTFSSCSIKHIGFLLDFYHKLRAQTRYDQFLYTKRKMQKTLQNINKIFESFGS